MGGKIGRYAPGSRAVLAEQGKEVAGLSDKEKKDAHDNAEERLLAIAFLMRANANKNNEIL
eukprot:CAMPEP_0171412672 /NCGR_PEP_ID=MMETSP0880-20121228/33126_1 /TAXON_ID=67004 /ORGANISM="Thalassiosira weissflogii, Strain CCMP1336" /LENGTH=60 /DNA_ID=CAMNT_0011930115 /DNA_START=117 /DNA_END=295 /DNA_ORIENTATION=+